MSVDSRDEHTHTKRSTNNANLLIVYDVQACVNCVNFTSKKRSTTWHPTIANNQVTVESDKNNARPFTNDTNFLWPSQAIYLFIEIKVFDFG